MAKQRALIVDDSKTAQIRLRKMLERFDLEVDTVLSAEEALGYLSYRQPVVLFLDHHMEGMDGLEALKIIKSNPSTALIPVIMYTSEKGDVYVGQARALGAMDIIGKGTIKEESLEKVLNSLGISDSISSKSGRRSSTVAASSQEPRLPSQTSASNSSQKLKPDHALDKVHQQISRLFEMHTAKVRQEIGDSTKFLLRRLAKEERTKATTQKAIHPAPVVEYTASEMMTEHTAPSVLSTLLLGAILLCILMLGYQLYMGGRGVQDQQNKQYAELLSRAQAQEKLIGRLITKVGENHSTRDSAAAYADRQVLLDSLSWAVNVNTQVVYGEQGLSDQRIYMLGELLALLAASNFEGELYLDVHLGNFCVVEDMSGGWILPEPESNVEDCQFLAAVIPEAPIGELVSVGFLNYIHNAPILIEGHISVEMASRGYDEPQTSYPAITSATSAGDWNTAALSNNRIGISFSAN